MGILLINNQRKSEFKKVKVRYRNFELSGDLLESCTGLGRNETSFNPELGVAVLGLAKQRYNSASGGRHEMPGTVWHLCPRLANLIK